MADSLIEKLEACAEAHRMWSRKVPGSGQITMVANLLDEAAKRIAELKQKYDTAATAYADLLTNSAQEIRALQARLDAVAEMLRKRGRQWPLHEKVLNDAADELEQALEQKE